jgi:hypothetical protein
MKKLLSQSVFIFIAIFIITLINSTTTFAQATLTSDQNDYAPGATATFTGSGFLADETVKLQVVHASYVTGDPIGEDHEAWFVTADSDGNFVTTWHVCEDDCIGETLKAMADGESSLFHAEVLFTDANSALTKPTPVTAAYGSTITATSRLTQSGGAANGTPVAGKNIVYTISAFAAGSGITDANGVSTATSTVTLPVGSYAPIIVLGTYIGGGIRANWTGDAAFSSTTSFDTFTVTRATTTISAISGTGVYGSNVTLTATTNVHVNTVIVNFTVGGTTVTSVTDANGVATATITFAALAAALRNAGTYGTAVSVSIPASILNYYTAATATGPLTITPKAITVTAAAKTKVYGAADPALTFTAVGLVGSDILSGALSRTAGETVVGSPYAILQGTVTNANNPNYNISYTGANLAITTKAISVTATTSSKTYGNPDPVLAYTAVGLVGSDVLNGLLTRTAGENVAGSPYAILQGTVTNANNTNYAITYTGANFTINRRGVTVTADNQSKSYGDSDPPLTYVATNLAGSDVLSGSLTRVPGETVAGGPYDILQGSVTDANNNNYTISYAGGNLTIAPKGITVTADGQTKTYGDADPALTYVAAGLVGSDTLSGLLTRDSGETVAGSPYAILQGSVTDANNTNYSITYNGANLAITTKAITVTADPQTKTYGDADPPLTYVAVGLVGSDVLDGALTRDPGETVVGSPYAILQGTVSDANNSNYSITYTGANLTITTKAITVTADAKTKTYGDADPPLTYVAIGLVGTDTLSGALARDPGETVAGSPYAILQGTVTDANNSNYSITYTGALLEPVFNCNPGQMAPGSRVVTAVINSPNANYTINPLQPTTTLTITAEDASVVYSGLSYFSTSSATSCTANVTLSATVTDAADGNRGDIRNARVTFHSGSIAGPVLGTANLQPVPISAGNNTVGTVSVCFPYCLSSSDCADKGTTFTVYAVVTNYYTGNNNSDPGSVTISVPGSDAVTGGGHLVMSNSIGTYAGTAGAKTNFGFTMKYNKNGSNAKGQCNIIIRSNNKIYQIKSTAINSLSANGQYGSFSTKANLTDVTNPSSPISLGGNLDLLVDMYDYSNGGQNDEVSFSLKNGATILYLSYWTGTQNIRRVLNGGNIQIRNGSSASAKHVADPVVTVIEPLKVSVSPNPTRNQFELNLQNANTEKVTVRVMDLSGKTIMQEDFTSDQEISFGTKLPSATYFVEVSSGNQRKTVRAIKQ